VDGVSRTAGYVMETMTVGTCPMNRTVEEVQVYDTRLGNGIYICQVNGVKLVDYTVCRRCLNPITRHMIQSQQHTTQSSKLYSMHFALCQLGLLVISLHSHRHVESRRFVYKI